MDDDLVSLLVDLHGENDRQGPGSREATLEAIERAGLSKEHGLRVVDLGSGTGAATLVLAAELDAHVTAVDLVPEFLDRLRRHADTQDLSNRISTLAASIDDLPLPDESFDVVWSEGAVYNIGFANGVSSWRRLLVPGGTLVVSELTWLTDERPAELDAHWNEEYPEVGTTDLKVEALRVAGYDVVDHFVLGEECWIDNYYRPLLDGLDAFVERHDRSAESVAIAEAERFEADLYQRFSNYMSYGVYIARRP